MAKYIDINEVTIPKDFFNNLNTPKLLDWLNSQPTTDVAEVKHGYWINEPPYRTIDGRYLKAQVCSSCDAYFVSDANKPYSNHPYCCECGAKMDRRGGNDD